jgi:hypothetical protein
MRIDVRGREERGVEVRFTPAFGMAWRVDGVAREAFNDVRRTFSSVPWNIGICLIYESGSVNFSTLHV